MHRNAPVQPSLPGSEYRFRFGGTGVLGNLAVTLACLSAATAVQAQTKRCDLVGHDTTMVGNPTSFKRCLDLAGLDHGTVNVPANVTRIDNDGLSLCKSAVKTGGDVDMVYVYDNSGSMKANLAYVNTATNDTTFYEVDTNCSDKTRLTDSVTFVSWNTNGTVQSVTRKIPKLKSNANCTEFSGDPYNDRARAFYQGINDQHNRAPQSTAGLVAFTGNVNSTRRPLVLTDANTITVTNAINAVSGGGTSYGPPLDTAKLWLSTPAITSNPKKAVIFLSDGKPKDTYTVPAGMPPVYGIFLGKPRSDTAALATLSKNTGGKFFIIPPGDPDSLKSVVAQILNIVLLEYSPQSATITNTSLTPAQSAVSAPANFILQPDGSWLMKLSDVIGLKASGSNNITVSTTFKEKTSNVLETSTISFNISTTLPASGTTQKIGTTQFGMTCYDPSTLSILDAQSNSPSWFIDTNTVYQIRIRTAPAPLDSTTANASTRLKTDAENPLLKPSVTAGDSLVFKNPFIFKVSGAAKANGNGILESNLYDSIIVAWVHPRDPQDVAADTMLVRARIQGATVWFSQTNGGAATTQYSVSATTVYIVVKDQPADPRRTYTAIVTSESYGLDRETVTLTESPLGSGIMLGSIPINQLAAKNPGDGKLQAANLGDQFKVVYTDPVDGDVAVNTAGFDQSVEEAPDIKFTDASGAVLPPGTIWSPANGKLFISYSDDSVAMPNKQVFLTLVSRKYGAAIGTDHERIPLTLTGSSSATRATWTGSIDLADAFPAADSNGKAETRFRGEASISANSHTNKGVQEAGVVTDFLVIAYPDSAAAIAWKMDTTVASNEGLIVTVNDQSYNANQKDTALVTVACTMSGDSVSAFPAVEGPTATSGTYVSGTLVKDEGAPNLGDRTLSCQTTDQLRIRYVDPVYGTLTELLVDEVAKPEANPAGRTFITSELVAISSATPGALIYYTLDGSKPVPGVSPLYTDPIRISIKTTINAIAVKPGFKNSKIMTQTYVKEQVASRLEILDENGNSIPNGFLTGASQAVRIKLVTTQDNLTTTEAAAATKVAGDAETVILGNIGSLGSAFELSALVPLRHPSAKAPGNDTIEAIGTDTLIVSWVNPFNPADIAADTLVIKPAIVDAQVYFSATENGPKITEYPSGQDSIFIVVKTRPRDPALAYTVLVTSADGSGDRETLSLSELSPGVFSAKAPVGTGSKSKADNIIQVAAAGDQLKAVFTDPVYLTDYRGDAGFAQGVQESAGLEFIDENGKVVPATEVWSPDKGKVYLRYSDDWNPGIAALVRTMTVRLELLNRKSGDSVGADLESVVLTLKDSTASRGVWEGSLALADKASPRNGNDTLEAYYRGELRAYAQPHDNAGAAAGAEISDNLVIAYPDQPAEIVIRDTSGKAVDRKTDKVDIVIRDQQFTKSGNAGIEASVTCAQSGDKVAKVILIWNGGAYAIQPPLDKGELTGNSVDKTDALLVCRDADVLTVNYVDPVYLTLRSGDVKWSDESVPRMYFAASKDSSAITSASDAQTGDFLVIVEGKSPTRDRVDTIDVILTTAQGEQETFRAVETGILTGKFTVKVGYKFLSADPVKENKLLEARLTLSNRINQVLVSGSATVSGATATADLSLLSSYDLVARAYIKDEDENGRADHAYFVFDHKLSVLPSSLDEVFWNQQGPDFKRKAEHSMLSFKPGSDSTIVVADFTASQFGANLTDIPAGKPLPYGHFPDDNIFGGQKANLADSVGPVVVAAIKHPSSLQSYSVTTTEKRFFPDTLVITVSEKIKTSGDFNSLLRFSKGCSEYPTSNPVPMFSQPAVSPDGLTWTVIVDNAPDSQSPLVKDCIFLEANGRYTDLVDNRPGRLGVELTGENPNLVIREFRGFPPVAGLDPSTPGFIISTNDKRDGETGVWSNPKEAGSNTWVISWVPPYGFDPNDPVGSLSTVAKDFDNPQAGDRRPEVATPQPMPVNISAVQVISSGAYKANIRIFDNLGHFVRNMEQAYGGNGEDKNPWRATNNGQVSFLVWDMKDEHGDKVGNGVYVWKVAFVFLEKSKKSEVMYTRTGVVRFK